MRTGGVTLPSPGPPPRRRVLLWQRELQEEEGNKSWHISTFSTSCQSCPLLPQSTIQNLLFSFSFHSYPLCLVHIPIGCWGWLWGDCLSLAPSVRVSMGASMRECGCMHYFIFSVLLFRASLSFASAFLFQSFHPLPSSFFPFIISVLFKVIDPDLQGQKTRRGRRWRKRKRRRRRRRRRLA